MQSELVEIIDNIYLSLEIDLITAGCLMIISNPYKTLLYFTTIEIVD